MPESGNTIIISHQEPPLSFARLRANQSLGLINREALRLDNAELSEIVRLNDRSLRS